MDNQKLFMVVLGCRPAGRTTEQHDVFFGIGSSLKDLSSQMNAFWSDSGGLHIDSWREVTSVGDHLINIVERTSESENSGEKLFFINLGGYKENDLEEYHYKILVVAPDRAAALKAAKQTAFFKHTGLKTPGGASHIDDKYGIDVDDIYQIEDVLPADLKKRFTLRISKQTTGSEDTLHVGYLKFSRII